jgi:hypothetical protein
MLMLILGFRDIKERFELKHFISFNNWHHLVEISFHYCGWFNDDDWTVFVYHAHNFINLKVLDLRNISKIYFRL